MHRPSFHFFKPLLWLGSTALALLLSAIALDEIGIVPRRLAPYIEHRASGHNPIIVATGRWLAGTLLALDRGDAMPFPPPPVLHSANPASSAISSRAVTWVRSPEEAVMAIEHANPGDVITFAPGLYRFSAASYIPVNRAGQPGREITVRAEQPGAVQLEFNLYEGFQVNAPYWTFENLSIRGICKDHSDCEHAFHVMGKASHFTARHNTIVDFNAHFKINGLGDAVPDHGFLEGNILSNSTIRRTANPVTPIDLVAASHWLIKGNRISDFIKGDGDQISYGAFAKGGGEDNRFEQNMVICESSLRGAPGQRVGLSLGGGGTGKEYCRDRRCITEQSGSALRSNLILSCSDDGMDINHSSASIISHNTLIDTGPILVRFAESSADVEGNLVDSAIQSRDGAILRQTDNRQSSVSSLYLGRHPLRKLFVDTASFDFRWKDAPPTLRTAATAADLCGGPRPPHPSYGASEDYSQCLTPGR